MNAYLRVISTFTILVACFLVDRVIVTPLVEPESEIVDPSEETRPKKSNDLEPYFPPGSWEITEPNNRVDFGEGFLVFRDYEIEDRRIIHITACSFVFFPERNRQNVPAGAKQPGEELWVAVRVPDGAEFHLDSPIDLLGGKFGMPIWGKLHGEVEIYSPGKTDSPEAERPPRDDVNIKTRDVIYENGRVSSTQAVEFQFGSHTGRGHDFTAVLDAAPSGDGGGIQISGVRSFELRHLEYLRMRVPVTPEMMAGLSGGMPGGTSGGTALGAEGSPAETKMNLFFPVQTPVSDAAGNVSQLPAWYLPAQLTCDAAVFFDVGAGEATFSENVVITWWYANRVEDFLRCDKLQLNLTAEEESGQWPVASDQREEGKREDASAFSKLAPQRVIASGDEVILMSRQFSVEARGNQFSANIPRKVFTLESSHEATLRRENQEFHARSIKFTASDARTMEVNIIGSGWMQYAVPGSGGIPEDVFRARWQTEFRMYPDVEEEYAISLDGNVTVDSRKIGNLSADKLYLWLKKKTPAEIAWEAAARGAAGFSAAEAQPEKGMPAAYRLSRVRALNNVAFQVNLQKAWAQGKLARMDLWFLSVPEAGEKFPLQDILAAAGQNLFSGISGGGRNPGVSGNTGFSGNTAGFSGNSAASVYNIKAESIQGNIIQQDSLVFVSKVILENDIQIQEQTREEVPSEVPLYIRGDKITFTDVLPATLQAEIVGAPAVLKGRGTELSGNAVFMNCRANRAWVPGTGVMTMFLRNDVNRKPLPIPQQATIAWEDGMDFDGQTTVFSGKVRVRHPLHAMDAQQVQAVLDEKIVFSEMTEKSAIRFSNLSASGEVLTQNRVLQDGKFIAHMRLGAKKVDFSPISGDFKISGDGWLRATFDASDFLNSQEEKNAAERENEKSPPEQHTPPRLYHTYITFLDGADGNAFRREVTLRDRVVTVADEVTDWGTTLSQAVDPLRLGKYGFILKSNLLRMNQAPENDVLLHLSGRPASFAVEFQAEEDVRVEMASLSAKANRLTYSYLKDLMIMTGGRFPVGISFQEIPGAPRRTLEAQKIEFRPSSKAVSGDDLIVRDIF